MKVSAISATLAFLIASASARSIEARQTSEARFLLSGFGDNNGAVPGYTLTVPEDGSVHTIRESLDPLEKISMFILTKIDLCD